MTIATEKVKQSSVKYFLVRLEPARHISTLLASAGGGVYTYAFSRTVSKVERNGTALTETTVNPPTVNDTWVYADGTLKVKLASAPDSSTNVVVLYHYIYLSDVAISTYSNPLNSATAVVDWEPWLLDTPTVTMGFSDQSYGVLSIQASSVRIINPDRFFQKLLTSEDSFYRKSVDIWVGIGDSVAKVFSGFSDGISQVSRKSVTLDLKDGFSPLQKLAYMGDTFAQAHTPTSQITEYSFAPLPYVLGKSAHGFGRANMTFSWGGSEIGKNLSPALCGQAVYTGTIAQTPTTNNNRGPWAIARTSSGDFKTVTAGTVTQVYIYTPSSTTATLNGGTKAIAEVYATQGTGNLEIGDSFTVQHATLNAGATMFFIVTDLRNSGGETIALCILQFYTDPGTDQSRVSGLTIGTNQGPGLIVYQQGSVYMMFHGNDYTTSVTTLASGNKYMTITFLNGMESPGTLHLGMSATVDPSERQVCFRVTSAAAASHGAALKDVLTKAGMPTLASSFTAADAALSATCAFSIPSIDETTFGSYTSYCQKILQSTLGYLAINSSGEAVYSLLDAPSTGTTSVSDDNVGDIETKVTYADLVSEVVPNNPHFPKVDSSSVSAKARYLHGGDAKLEYPHVLEDISPRIADILAFRANPYNKYSFKGSSFELIEETLGGDLAANLSELLGSSQSGNIKITRIDISKDGISIEASEFQGL